MARSWSWRRGASQASACAVLLGAAMAVALPVDNLQVESRVTEVRALPLQGLQDLDAAATGDGGHHHGGHHHGGHHHGGEGGGHHGTVGYLRTKDSKGDHGYQKFDSFHKKNGDSYGFETHSAFGKAKDHGDHEGAGTEDVEFFAGFGGGDGGHFSEHYTGGEGGGEGGHFSGGEGGGDGGDGGHYSEHYSSGGDGDGGEGSHAGYSSGGDGDFHGFGGEYH